MQRPQAIKVAAYTFDFTDTEVLIDDALTAGMPQAPRLHAVDQARLTLTRRARRR